eukprot:scaffold4189_cov378-Prasinococcus_capsulatus_cf.AAC.9
MSYDPPKRHVFASAGGDSTMAMTGLDFTAFWFHCGRAGTRSACFLRQPKPRLRRLGLGAKQRGHYTGQPSTIFAIHALACVESTDQS